MRDLEIERNKVYIEAYKKQQILLDPEHTIHSPELYAVWNLKHFLTSNAARINPFNSEFFIYTDSGAWRTRVFKNWPYQHFIRNLSNFLDNRVIYGQVSELTVDDIPNKDLLEG